MKKNRKIGSMHFFLYFSCGSSPEPKGVLHIIEEKSQNFLFNNSKNHCVVRMECDDCVGWYLFVGRAQNSEGTT